MPFSSADPNAFFGMGIQSALGTPQTTQGKFKFIKYLSGTEVQAQPEIVYLREGGDGLNWGYGYKKSQKSVGQLVFNARPDQLGLLFQALPGGATWAGASLPALHNFYAGHASFPWSTLQIAHPGTSLIHFLSDVRFTGLTIEGNSGEPIKVTAPFVAINHGASSTILTPTYGVPTGSNDPFVYHFSPSYRLDGSVDTSIGAWKFDVGLGIEELQAQSVTLDEQVVQNQDINVEVTMRYENSTLWKKINMGAGVSPTTSVPTGSLDVRTGYDGGGAQATRALQISAYNVGYSSDQLTELDPDGKTVMQTVSGKALANGATWPLVIALNNGHASAY